MDNVFNIPKIMSEDESSVGSEYEENDVEHHFTRLTSLIRSQYFSYLKKVMDQNYQEWNRQHSYNAKNIPAEYLDRCAMQLEERAVKCSMVVQLYRKYMLRIITGIRRDTTCGKLISKLKTGEMDIKEELLECRQGRNKHTDSSGVHYKLEARESSSESELLHQRNKTESSYCDEDGFQRSYTPTIQPGIKSTRRRKAFLDDRKSVNVCPRKFYDDDQNLKIHKISSASLPLHKMHYNAFQDKTNLQYSFPLGMDLGLTEIAYESLSQDQEKHQASCVETALSELLPLKTSQDRSKLSLRQELDLIGIINCKSQDNPNLLNYQFPNVGIINCKNPDKPNLVNYQFPNADSSLIDQFPDADSSLIEEQHKEKTTEKLCDAPPSKDASSPASSTNMSQNEQNLEKQQSTFNESSLTEMRYEFLSLQEKIQHFQEKLNERENLEDENKRICQKRKRSPPPLAIHDIHKKLFILPAISQPISPVSTSSEEESNVPIQDSIAKDLESLFAEGTNGESDDIFGDGSYNPEIDYILREIEKSELPGCDVKNSTTTKETRTKAKIKRYKLQPVICDMNDSLWPCELHMWKQTLREILSHFSVDIRHHERIRQRFFQLFGEDSEDEFAPYSPTLELDDVLISSCMKRIAPIIVKYLMRPMKDGLIANRYLFKKLAKKLAYSIVMDNQYADEDYIKERIDVLFVFRRNIKCLEDIDIT